MPMAFCGFEPFTPKNSQGMMCIRACANAKRKALGDVSAALREARAHHVQR